MKATWIKFVAISFAPGLCVLRFSGFPPSTKHNISKPQIDIDTNFLYESHLLGNLVSVLICN